MARDIDPKNLDDQDKRYLFERPWLIDKFSREGNQAEMDRLREELPSTDDTTTRIGTDDMRLGNQPVYTDKPPSNLVQPDEDDDVDDDYDSWTKADLEAEVDARNSEEERADEDKISKTGTKAELVERLKADDA